MRSQSVHGLWVPAGVLRSVLAGRPQGEAEQESTQQRSVIWIWSAAQEGASGTAEAQKLRKELQCLVEDPGVTIARAAAAWIPPRRRSRYFLCEATVVVHRSCRGWTWDVRKKRLSGEDQEAQWVAAGASSSARAAPREMRDVLSRMLLSVYGT